jgi:hypothetical protein
MRLNRLSLVAAAIVACALVPGEALLLASSASAQTVDRDGSFKLAGRSLRCGRARNIVDRKIPIEGMSAPGMVILNPSMLQQHPENVRVFIFHHECAHQHVGGDELGADCWAVKRGVTEGWLDKKGLGEVCRSFGDAPESATHPSGRRRCRNIDRCFAAAVASQPPSTPPAASSSTVHAVRAEPRPSQPKLIAEPKLVRTGVVRGATGGAAGGEAAGGGSQEPGEAASGS